MMHASGLRDGDHLSDPTWHDRARVRAILVERRMRGGALVVVDTRGQDATQMPPVEDHDVIETLAANRTNHALDMRSAMGNVAQR